MKVQILAFFLFLAKLTIALSQASDEHHPLWLVNYPPCFHQQNHSLGKLIDVTQNPSEIQKYEVYVDNTLKILDGWTDGENVDSLEHFFWGMTNGVALELGGLDGSPLTRSMTYDYVKNFGWKRIVIDGNPQYRENLKKNSPDAFGVIAAICDSQTTVHYATREFVGGILEFMSQSFLKEFYPSIYQSTTPNGDLKAVDWANYTQGVFAVDCIPLSLILHKAHVTHINFFILDVEGGELDILKSIHWNKIVFDVICVETEASHRPPGYPEAVTEFLSTHGYKAVTKQIGRNIWFTRSDFVPQKRSTIHSECFRGMEKASGKDPSKPCLGK